MKFKTIVADPPWQVGRGPECKPPHGIGLGGTYTLTTEHCLFARRGTCAAAQRIDSTWFKWPRGAHSEKPDAFLDLVETVSPVPRIELFARSQRLGWSTWGNESLCHITLPVPEGSNDSTDVRQPKEELVSDEHIKRMVEMQKMFHKD